MMMKKLKKFENDAKNNVYMSALFLFSFLFLVLAWVGVEEFFVFFLFVL
jgi:hypothetical protein